MKQEPKEFIIDLLTNAGCKNVHLTGENIRCQCPFHWPINNTDAFSISFNETDGFGFHCFSCDEHGDIVSLIAHINRCSIDRAKKLFKKRVLLTEISLQYLKDSIKRLTGLKSISKKEMIIEMPPIALDNSSMWEYLTYRNRTEQHNIMDLKYIVSKYGLYYCDSGRYTNRIIMPIRDMRGNNVFFTNRAVQAWRKKNLFEKGSDATDYLYGLYESGKKKKCFLVEGPFDVYQLKSYALKNRIFEYGFIGNMGTKMTEERAAILSSLFEECNILFDHDKEGLKGELIAYEILFDFMPVNKMTEFLYPGKDPAVCNEEQLGKVFISKPAKGVRVSL